MMIRFGKIQVTGDTNRNSFRMKNASLSRFKRMGRKKENEERDGWTQ